MINRIFVNRLFQLIYLFTVFVIVMPVYGQVINEDLKLIASDRMDGDSLGYSIAIDQGIVAVGSPFDDDNGRGGSGSVYLFDIETGLLINKLTADDAESQDWFGSSVAMDQGIIAIGAYHADDFGYESGSAYLFDVMTGKQLYKLSDDNLEAGDQFGRSIAIDQGIVAIGANGHNLDKKSLNTGTVFLFDATTGEQLRKLAPTSTLRSSQFGFSVAIQNGFVAVGAPGGFRSAYLFDAMTGKQLYRFTSDDPDYSDDFGYSIAIDQGIVAVGARYDNDIRLRSGAAYIFDVSTGSQRHKLTSSDSNGNDQFGFSIAIDQGIVAVGSRFNDDGDGFRSGSAYLFDSQTGSKRVKLTASDAAAFDRFGGSVSIDQGIVGVGAHYDDVESGSAYLYDVCCQADFNCDLTLNFFDISIFLNSYSNGDLVADFTGDGILNFFDVSAFLKAFNAGCP
tara:strand:+ start:4527 stop:5879 length:1353 start_codon:yes stop_codon:yes gene_type:complete